MTSFYDTLVSQDAAQPAAAPAQQPVSFYDTLKAQDEEEGKLRASVAVASKTSPDKAAQQQYLSKVTGLPLPVVQTNEGEAQARVKFQQINALAKTSPVLKARLMDPEFTAVAQDDVGTLASIGDTLASAAKYIVSAPNQKNTLAGDVGAGVLQANRGAAGVFQLASEFIAPLLDPLEGRVPGGNPLRRLAEGFASSGAKSDADAKTLSPPPDGTVASGVSSGVQSFIGNALMLPLAVLPGGEAAVLYGMSAQQGGQSYQDAREKGIGQNQAAIFAASQAVIEYATEKLPMHALIGDVKAGAPIFKSLLHQIGLEVPGEQIATALQDLNEWSTLHPEKPFSDYLAERPAAALQTLIATAIGVGGNVALVHGIQHVADSATGVQRQQQMSQSGLEHLKQLMALAGQAKMREHSPQTFAEVSQEMAEKTNGAPTEVRFDARTLGEVLNQEEMAKLPSLAPQMQEALATGGEVRVPIGELMANVAGTPLEQKLTEHARVGDNELSAAEAKEAATQAESYLQSEATRVIGEANDSAAHQASADTVKQSLLDQFEKLGRFTPDVNSAYATIASNMYTALGARLGMTPEQAYAAHPLTINGVNPAKVSDTLNKGTRTGEVSVEGYHYSKQQRSQVSTDMFGTGLAGSSREEYQNATDKRLGKRAYFYVDKGTGINPEAGVGGYAHKAQLSNIYDADTDPLRLNKGGKLAFESAVLDAGFSGYLNRLDGTQSGQVVLLGPQAPTKVEALGQMTKTKGAVVAPKGQRESLGRDQVVDALQANKDLPAGYMPLSTWDTMLAKLMPEEHAALDNAGVFKGAGNAYKSDLIKAFEAATEAPVYNQSATLRSGEETLAKYGLPLGGKYKTRDIAAALEARQREKYGKIDPTDRSDEAADKIANWMAEEVRFEMLHPRKSGVGWYSYKFQRALDTFGDIFPELKKDKDARATLTALIAITSDGQSVLPNFRMAVDLYRNFRDNGKFTTDRGHSRMDSIQGNVDLLQKMLDDMGPKAMRKYLLQEATVSELRKRAKAEGVDFKTDYQASVKLPMAAVTFGPKLGAFYANLMGASGYLTMDRWWSRTFNRYRGTLLQAPTADGLARIKELMGHPEWSDDQVISATVEPRKSYEAKNFKNGTEIEKAANTVYKAAFENLEDAPFNATDRSFMLGTVAKAQQILEAEGRKISVADIQAVLWYYEKRLYGELGARQSADVSYEDAAKKVVGEQPDSGEPGRSDARGADGGAVGDDTGTAAGVSEEAVAPGLEPFNPGEVDGGRTYQQAGNGSGRSTGRSLAPLEGAPSVTGFHGPDPRLVAVAEQYARDNGIELRRQNAYVQVDPERAKRLADAYEAMAHAPTDPRVQEAYQNLIQQTMAQYKALEAAGYKFWFIDTRIPSNAEYASTPWNAMRDTRANQQMGVFPTTDGFGSSELDVSANPLLADTGLQWPVGGVDGELQPVLANDLFRAVHDAFGHGLEGAGFRADGEENAWQAHSRLFTGSALGAITSETRGQNSWLNYGPHGEANRNAKVEDTVFAPQKTGLMPEWTWTEGRAGDQQDEVLNQAPANKYQTKYLAGRDLASLNADERAQYDVLATKQTDTPEFKKWFGDSKVVDAEGNPLVVYHGTNQNITSFDPSKIGSRDAGFFGSGFYLTPDADIATDYADSAVDDAGKGEANTMVLYAAIKNPFVWDMSPEGAGQTRAALAAMGIKRDDVRGNSAALSNAKERDTFNKAVRAAGHDGVIVRDEDGIQEVVAFSPTQVKSATGNKGTFDPASSSVLHAPNSRGTFNPKSMTVSLLEGADLSTFHHEMAHFYLEVLANIASGPNAPASIMNDMDILLKWFGVKDLAAWNAMSLNEKRASHEKFAEHYERYLFEGKAPSLELQGLFRRFASWMKDAYKHMQEWMSGMGKTLTPEVRGVYDRMLATEAQIEQAESARNYAPLFKSAEQAGMTPEAWALYQLQSQDATEQAIENLQARSLRDTKWMVNAHAKALKAITKDVEAKRKAVEAEVKMQVASMPVYEAKAYLDALHKPTADDKAASAAHKALRDAAEAKAMEEAKAALPGVNEVTGLEKAQLISKSKRELANTVDRAMIAWDKANPKPQKTNAPADLQVASEMFGYSSPDEMLRAIHEAEPFASVVEGMTDQRLLERYGDLATPAGIERAANEAIHNEARAKFLATELKALSEGMRITPPDRSKVLEQLKECLAS